MWGISKRTPNLLKAHLKYLLREQTHNVIRIVEEKRADILEDA